MSGRGRWLDWTGLLLIELFFLGQLPLDLLRSTPASGGDMGSHYWPLHTLVHFGIPHGVFPVWNPGNNGGEPQLVHYFPLPFFVMAALSLLLPLGAAFNIGTLLPLLALPLTVYYCLYRMELRRPTPLLGAALSLPFLYNERYSMWGGNTLSTLAGQFAHGYALCLLLWAVGRMVHELRHGHSPVVSALLFAGVMLSHAYVALAIPFFLLSIVLFIPVGSWQQRVLHAVYVSILALLFSAWFLVPLVTNQPWTTAMPMRWAWPELKAGTFAPVFLPTVILGALALIIAIALRRPLLKSLLFWAVPLAAYVALFYIFPRVGLVDIRAVPQIQLIGSIAAAILVGNILAPLHKPLPSVVAAVLILSAIAWCSREVTLFPRWLAWNYSGWTAKPPYLQLQKLYTALHGTLSDPRVIYEHSPRNEAAGSVRVFEMLPYFAERATLESVYTQSTVLAPAVYRLQSEVSRFPSCPLRDYPCGPQDLCAAEPRLRLLGVSDFIAVEPSTFRSAARCSYLQESGSFGQWRLYHLNPTPSLVGIIDKAPTFIPTDNWKTRFYEWFTGYTGEQPLLVVDDGLPDALRVNLAAAAPQECRTSVEVTFAEIRMTTNCPGVPHLLKFAYHPSWRASTNDRLFLTSPGFIGIVPSAQELILTFGQSPSWKFSRLISAAALIGALFFLLARIARRRTTANSSGPQKTGL